MQINDTKNDRVIQAALQGLTARQRAIADNVANVDTPQFKATHVSFEKSLQQALGADDQPLRMMKVQNGVAGPDDASADLKPTVTLDSSTGRRNDGNNVDIDGEMLELSDTNIRFNSLIQVMNSKMQILRYAINDGKR
ncbi:MAG: flagellar basal body rod protein FlgB [Chloroflexota bacterium]